MPRGKRESVVRGVEQKIPLHSEKATQHRHRSSGLVRDCYDQRKWSAPNTTHPLDSDSGDGHCLLGVQGSEKASASAAGGQRWYEALLEEGETQGFKWGIGAKVPMNKALGEICVLAGFLAPPQPGVPYGEGDSSTVCGNLTKPTESVSTSATLGSTGTTLVATLYRPAVRKVSILLSNGKRKVLRPLAPGIPNRAAMGIPAFRYLVASVDGGACVRQVTTFNGKGKVLAIEGEPCSG